MLHRRLHRRLVAWLLAVCVLFAQSVAVAYACDRLALPEIDAAPPCSAHLGHEGASQEAPQPLANGNVCEVHCHSISLPDAGATDVPAPMAVLAWRLPALVAAEPPPGPVEELEARGAAPPFRTLFARLLI